MQTLFSKHIAYFFIFLFFVIPRQAWEKKPKKSEYVFMLVKV